MTTDMQTNHLDPARQKERDCDALTAQSGCAASTTPGERRRSLLRSMWPAALAVLLALGACGDDDTAGTTRDPSQADDDTADDDADDDESGDDDSTVGDDGDDDDDDVPGAIDAGRRDAGGRDASPRDAGSLDATAIVPTKSDAGADVAPDSGAASAARQPLTSLKLPTIKESPKVAPWFNVYRPKDLSAKEGPLPVILWANGGCFRAEDPWKILLDRWAAAGFVVLALTAGDTALGALMQSTVDDQAKLVDWVIEQNSKQGGPYAGKLDLERIVAAGNSCGGVTALGVAAKDPRIASVFVLSGSSAVGAADKEVMSKIKAPMGYVVGGSEDIAGANAAADYDLVTAGVPAVIVSRAMGDHVTVSTDMKILEDVAEISLNWLDLSLYGTKEAYDTLTSSMVCASCDAGPWKLKAKEIEKLQK